MDERCQVTIYPEGKRVEVERGTLIADALALAGVEVPLPCGGQGRCGRCKVRVEGVVKRRATNRLKQDELAEGWLLACQALIEGDLVVHVPPAEEIVKARPERGVARVSLPLPCGWEERPILRALPLEIEPPSLADNTADFERVRREMARQHGVRGVVAGLPLLRSLARTVREADWRVTAVVEEHTWADPDGPPRLIALREYGQTALYGVAIDIGTTSNVVYLVSLDSGEVLEVASAYNAQIACGEDVISRIIYATKREGGLRRLQELVLETLNGLIAEAAGRRGIDPEAIDRATVAGNPTMIHLFLGLNPESIRLEPYIPTINHPLPVRAGELGLRINPEATVDCLPGVGAYVGADITAGVLSSGMSQAEELTLFIDVGTNGEMVLGNKDWLLSCACSAGPAFEGGGVQSGMRAVPGAIEDVWIDTRTYEPTWRTIGDLPPRGICGSGMIALLAELFLTGVIDKAGKFDRGLRTPRVRQGEHGWEYVVAWAEETAEGVGDVVLTEVDIANLLRAKAAIYAGFSVLVRSVGLELDAVEQVLIGGAFGKYIDLEKAVQIGLLPDMPLDRFRYLGNTSVQGAYAALLCADLRETLEEIAGKMTYLELSADNSFYDAFTEALFLPHTHLDRFPSVARWLTKRGAG